MSTPLPIGTLLVGNNATYKVLKQLGQGGFGITYLTEAEVKANDIPFKLKFAVKEHFISSLCERDGNTTKVRYSSPVANEVNSSLRAFVREAQRVKSLGIENRNIVKISEVFQANNTAYYVMEYLEGETLADRIIRKGKLSVDETLAMMQPICMAVAQLHANRLAHYDIKPMNIIIARDRESGAERPVLIDFGLSKHYNEEGKATSTLSQGGYSQGYSPVEQYGGLSDYSPQSDVYSLAATMYHCLTGNVLPIAYAVDTSDVNSDLAGLGVPENIRYAVCHALEIKREQRPDDAGAFYKELFSRSTVPLPRPNPTPEPVPHPGPTPPVPQPTITEKSKKPWFIAAMVAAALLLTGLIVFLVNRGGDDYATDPDDTMLVAQLDDQLVIEEPVIESGVLEPTTEAMPDQSQQQDQQRQQELDRQQEDLQRQQQELEQGQQQLQREQQELQRQQEQERQRQQQQQQEQERQRQQEQERTTTIPSQPDGYKGEHGYVDMGGNMGKWAWCNIGASSPTGYGNYYQWGEINTAPGGNYTDSNCQLYGKKNVGGIGGSSIYDAASHNWGKGWRLPTMQQYDNLIAGCNTEVRIINGIKGMLFTSKANGKTLFFPFAGGRVGTSSKSVGSYGLFWTSTTTNSNTNRGAYLLYVYSDGNCCTGWGYRSIGQSVRAVPE